MPIRTVLFTKLCKFDGHKTGILSARDFHQIAGRAGRKGFDDRGWVVVQAPEHMVENLKLEEKASKDGKKSVKRKAPEKNFVNWDKQTFIRLIHAPPERLTSRFQVSHGMLLNVLSRDGDGCRAMQRLIRENHETPKAKKEHTRRAWQLFRSLTDRKIIEFIPRTESGAYLRVNVELQDDFSMDQTLSLYLLDTLALIDPSTANTQQRYYLGQGAYQLALDWSEKRHQFGRPIGEFQGLQWKLADMSIKLSAARALVYNAARSGEGGFPDMLLAAQAKVFTSESAIQVVNDALQFFGARGYSRELPLERMARDVRMFTIGGGTAQVLRTLVASKMLGWKLPQTRDGYGKEAVPRSEAAE
jgi:hypothetical protein